MPPLFWLDVAALSVSLVIAAALALMVSGFGLGPALNRSFVALALTHVAWAIFSLLMRLTLWLEKGNPLFMSELITLSFALTGICLLIFTVLYLGRQTRWTDLAAVVGLAMVALLCAPLFRYQLVSHPRLDANGATLADVSAWGLVAAILPLVYMAWSLVLFWQERRHTGESYLAASVLILLAGHIMGGASEVRFPITSVAHAFSLALLGYGVVSRQLFNPLRERTAELQHEITERKQVEEALRGSEERYRTLFEHANDAIFVENEDDEILDVNPRACELLGYSREELLTMKVTDLLAPRCGGRSGT